MDVHQLKTFVAVARDCSITRASQRLHLSQPAVSAHIKAIEDTVGLALFERTSRGMRLTSNGRRLLTKAELTLEAHRSFIEEATRIKGRPTGRFRLGAESDAGGIIVRHVLRELSRQCPDVEVTLEHGTARQILDGIRSGCLDAGLYNNCGDADADLERIETARSDIYLAAPPGMIQSTEPIDWAAIANLTWICPASRNCSRIAAEELFMKHNIRPRQIVGVDRERMTHALIAGGIGVGLLHGETLSGNQANGPVEIVCKVRSTVAEYFAHLPSRASDPLLDIVTSIIRSAPNVPENHETCFLKAS
jgi:DNA-binding transcriptional LysR family regulator